MEIASTIVRNWRLIVALPLVLAFLVGVRTLTSERSWSASASFTPHGADGRSGGSAAALAQQFGISLGGDRGTQSSQFYADLIRNRSILRQAVESEYEVRDEAGERSTASLIEIFEIEGRAGIPAWSRAADRLRRNVSVSLSRETGVANLSVTASQPELAEQVAGRLLELVNAFNLEVRQERAQEEGRFAAERMTEVYTELLAAERALHEFLMRNREFRGAPELVFEHDRLQRQVAMHQDVYTSLLRAREQARLDAVRNTPVLTILEDPAGSAVPVPRGTVTRTLVAFLLGGILALIVAFIREAVRRGRQSADPEYQEFEGVARQAWDEIRRPDRWLGRSKTPVAAGDS